MIAYKVVFLKPWFLTPNTIYYYINNQKNGLYLHFQQDSNTLKYVIFGYCMKEL